MNVILERNILTPPWNATAQKQCAALGLMCPTLRKKSGKQASELASKQPSKLPSMQPASELACDAGRLGEESEEDSGGYCAADYAGYVWSHCVH